MTRWTSDVDANGNRLTNLNELWLIRHTTEGRPAVIGTDSAHSLTIYVNDRPALHFEPTDGTVNIVAGHQSNAAEEGVEGATCFGGETEGQNEVLRSFGTIGGGRRNAVEGTDAAVGGGAGNKASNEATTVAGGNENRASSFAAAIAGGAGNEALAGRTAIGGGEDNKATELWATIGGGQSNVASGQYATIAGGGPVDTDAIDATRNRVLDAYGTVGGGGNNQAGNGNDIEAKFATVSGGEQNTANREHATVSGGGGNVASGVNATVGGGRNNKANGSAATICGGSTNTANGDYSFAAGRGATADHNGAFVFGDSSNDRITSKFPDEMRFQMPIYTLGVNNTSARSAKTNIKPVDPLAALEDVESLEISTWEFRDRDNGQHMGPMAEDFAETFGLGDDDESIATIDAEGVALAAIQGLASELDEKTDKLDEKSDRIDGLKMETEKNSTQIDDLEQEVAEKNERLTKIEQEHEALQEQYARLAERIEELEEASLS